MLDTELCRRLTELGIPHREADRLTAKIRDRLHPISAVAAVKLREAAEARGNGAAGLAGTPRDALKYGSMGAQIGKVAGPWGAAIGAIVGTIAGFAIKKGHKAERAQAALQLLAQLRGLPTTMAGRLLPYGQLGQPKGYLMLFQALYLGKGWMKEQGTKLYNHPTSMDNMSLQIIEIGRRILQQLVSTPVGSQCSIDWPRPGGTGSFGSGYTFLNQGVPADAPTFFSAYYQPALIAEYQTSPWSGAAVANYTDSDAVHVLTLVSDHLLADLVPVAPSVALATQPIADVPTSIVAAGNTVAQQVVAQNPSVVTNPPAVVVPTTTATDQSIPYSPGYGWVATPDPTLNPTQQATAGILQSQISDAGYNLVSPAGQQVVNDVARSGVTPTKAPATGGSLVLPVGLLSLALLR